MRTNCDLIRRIDAELFAAEKRREQFRSQSVQEYQDRQVQLKRFERALDEVWCVWQPRLDALTAKFGDRVEMHSNTECGQRMAAFQFRSNVASVSLRLSAAPGDELRKLVVSYDVKILPILMEFNSHDQLEQQLDAINLAELAQWLDDRIVDFVRTYVALNENQYYLQYHIVEDPIAKVRFPKFAAAAKLEQNGKTIYFIDESTLREFENRSKAQTPTEGIGANK